MKTVPTRTRTNRTRHSLNLKTTKCTLTQTITLPHSRKLGSVAGQFSINERWLDQSQQCGREEEKLLPDDKSSLTHPGKAMSSLP